MKKLLVMLLTLCLLMGTFALAEEELPNLEPYTDEELLALSKALTAEMEKRGLQQPDETPQEAEPAQASEPAPAPQYETLAKGSKGDAVQKLQQRLIELNYLSGSADGDFGAKTQSAVQLFQKDAGLTATGTADAATQEALFADDAPVAKVYLDLDFKAISRDPNSYKGKNYKFTGRVVQVLEDELLGSTYVTMRIATKGNYDDVVYVTYTRDSDESRILEDDRVSVYGTCEGLYTYETIIGGSVTLPKFTAESVTLS